MEDMSITQDQGEKEEIINIEDVKNNEGETEVRKGLLQKIRERLLIDPSAKINIHDILPQELFTMDIESLTNILTNIDLELLKRDSGLGKPAIEASAGLTRLLSNDTYEADSAIEDEKLIEDVDRLILEYFGHVPALARVMVRFLSHVKPVTIIEEETKKKHE